MLQQILSLYITRTTLLLLLLSICYVMSQQCTYSQGIDLFGNDLYLTYSNTIAQCCTACTNDANCQAWTYVPDTQACWIKSGMGSVRQGVSQRILNTSLFPLFFFKIVFLLLDSKYFKLITQTQDLYHPPLNIYVHIFSGR